ncbi:MAG: hypothetical protein LC796_08875 [Acidobacteria bacterium]|nr:hypothetical protein [Acidobacteriota bacterium]
MILLDLHTPEMKGLEFRRLQRSDPALADIAVIVLTGHLDLGERGPAARRGVLPHEADAVPRLVEVVAHFPAPRLPAGAGDENRTLSQPRGCRINAWG